MSGARSRRPAVRRPALRVVPKLSSVEAAQDPARVARAVSAVAAIAETAAASPFVQTAVVEVTLATGTNRLDHGLGMQPLGVIVTPKTASAGFAWAFDWDQPTNPHPERQAWIDVVGGPAVCRVVFFGSAAGTNGGL